MYLFAPIKFQATEREARSSEPTLKDADFKTLQEKGFSVHIKVYIAFADSLRKCVSILKLAGVTNFSFMLGVRYVTGEDETVNEQPVVVDGEVIM